MAEAEEEPVWIQLMWDQPTKVRMVQITFDTGFQRELTLSASESVTRRMVRGPQPETVRDYALRGLIHGHPQTLVEVTGNYQRLCRHELVPPGPLLGLRLELKATNGAPIARVYEIRCYS
jgi:hypothetical protein